jgi:hypothetical protein
MGDNVFMRMDAEEQAAHLRRQNAALRISLDKISRLAPEEIVIPLDRAFAIVREMASIARNALEQ